MPEDRPLISLDIHLESMRATIRTFVQRQLSDEAVEAAISRAFEKFDIAQEIERVATIEIREAIASTVGSMSWGMRQVINAAVERRVEAILHPIVERVKSDVLRTNGSEDDDDGCPVDDPDCMGNGGDCHDACEAPEVNIDEQAR